MLLRILNTNHFPIFLTEELKKEKIFFKPYQETILSLSSNSTLFREIRSNKGLIVNQFNPEAYLKRHNCVLGNDFNFCYDSSNQHKGDAYIYAIEALSNPIKKHLQGNVEFVERPVPGKDGKAINVRYFSSMRISQQGKTPVGPHDVFYSHGLADKNYWIGSRIKNFKYAFSPGPIWSKRMRKTGYKGEIFEVGYTKLDPVFEARNKLKEAETSNNFNQINLLWLPTHGYANKNVGRSSFPMFEKYINLIDPKFNFLNSKHPTTKKGENKKQLPTLKQYCNNNTVIIADAGSTLYEAWALGIPVIFPDWICKKDIMKHFSKDKENLEYIIYSKQIGYHAKDIQELNKMVEIAASNGMKDEEKDFIENIFPEKLRGKSGIEAAKALKDIRKTFKKY